MGGGSSSVGTSVSGGIASGEVSIVADPRLNCLVIRANPNDMSLIEDLIKIIDQEDSPTSIETRGKPRLIPVINNDVEDIANIVKQVFADRIAQAASAVELNVNPPHKSLSKLFVAAGEEVEAEVDKAS